MSIDIEVESARVDDVAERRSGAPGRTLPNVSGDLPTVLAAAPMFRRAVAGYDRFQVESYVQWAEDELAAADRERERLLTRQLETVSALEEARELLSHSAGGGELLRVSRRIGALLAAAADEAAALRGEAAAELCAAETEAQRLIADARRRAAATETLADRSLAAARAEAAAMIEQAQGIVATAEQDASRLRAAAEERLAAAREQELRAAAEAGRIRAQAADEAAGARLQARGEILRMLAAGREERRRADAEAAAVRLSFPAAR